MKITAGCFGQFSFRTLAEIDCQKLRSQIHFMIYFSSISFKPGSLELLFEQLRNLGISKIELTGDRQYTDNSYALLKSESENNDIMLHNYCMNSSRDFILNLAASIEDERNVPDHVKELIEISSS